MDPAALSALASASPAALLLVAIVALWRRQAKSEAAAEARETGLATRVRQLEDGYRSDLIGLTRSVVAALETSAVANRQACEALDRNARAFERWMRSDSGAHSVRR